MELTSHTNQRENTMSSPSAASPVSPVSTESHTSGAGIFIALVPWVVFTILAQHVSLELGSLIALVVAAVIALPGVRAGRPKALAVRAVLTFAAVSLGSLVL